jgi:hypothetical protein
MATVWRPLVGTTRGCSGIHVEESEMWEGTHVRLFKFRALAINQKVYIDLNDLNFEITTETVQSSIALTR